MQKRDRWGMGSTNLDLLLKFLEGNNGEMG